MNRSHLVVCLFFICRSLLKSAVRSFVDEHRSLFANVVCTNSKRVLEACRSVLQHVVACCSVLQRVAVCCIYYHY